MAQRALISELSIALHLSPIKRKGNTLLERKLSKFLAFSLFL